MSAASTKPNDFLARDVDNYHGNVVQRGDYRSQTHCKLHFINIPPAKERRHDETNIQFEKIKCVCSRRQISPNKYAQSSRFSSGTGLDGKNRPSSGIFSLTHCTQPSKVLTPIVQRQTISNDLSAVRTELCAQSICNANKLDSSTHARARYSRTSIFGRLPPSSPESIYPANTCCDCSGLADKSGLENKQRKIHFSTTEVHRVSRCCMGHMEKCQISSAKTKTQTEQSNTRCIPKSKSKSRSITESNRYAEFCKFCRAKRKVKLSSPSSACKCSIKSSTSHQNSIGSTSDKRIVMVANKFRDTICNPQPSPFALSDHRCKRYRMGSEVRQQESTRDLDSFRANSTLQSKRTYCYNKGFTRIRSLPELKSSPHSMRQQDYCLISTQRRRNQISSPRGPYERSVSAPGSLQNTHDHTSPSRQLQLGCRSLITIQSSSGVASSAQGNKNHLLEMGHARNRSVCLSSSACGTDLLLSRQNRPTSQISRRSRDGLGFQSCMGISATLPDAESACSLKQSKGHLHDSSPKMGESILATRPEEPSNRTTLHDQTSIQCTDRHLDRTTSNKSLGNDFGGLEMWGWESSLKDWSDEQKSLLLASWRCCAYC